MTVAVTAARRFALAAATLALAGCQVQRVMTPEPVRMLQVERVARLTDRVATSNTAWSADGERIAYGASEGIFVHAWNGEPERKLVALPNATDIGWAPGQTTLSVVRAGKLAMVSVRDGTVADVAVGGVVRAFRWPPVGDRGVAIVESVGRTRLILVSADGGLRRLIHESAAGEWTGDLTWERTGIFAYVRVEDAAGRTTGILRIRFAGSDRATFPAPAPSVTRSAVDPTGKEQASIIGEGGAAQLVVTRLRGGGARVLAAGQIAAFAWSPQGDKLAYAEMAPYADRATIWAADADGGGRLRLAAYRPELVDHAAMDVAWSPTGRALSFGTNTGRSAGPIWVASFDRR